MKTATIIKTSMVILAMTAVTPAFAGVQFRIAHESSSNEYVVYMTTDSVPNPDIVLSSQVTLVVPHMMGKSRFDVTKINSAINNITWANHSRVDAPSENPKADYLSFGLFYKGSKPPAFAWEANKEKRIFSFTSNNGCISGITLISNSDPFNQLPNSVDTNPGNEFSNIGWIGGNMFTGNYGSSITCGVTGKPPVTTCEKSIEKLANLNKEIGVISTLLTKMSVSTQRDNMQKKVEELRGLLLCSQ
ncbi:MAG: hypothetical protein RI964_1936 [Pseudomonadota bacterium]|jgi:hypothetical protein